MAGIESSSVSAASPAAPGGLPADWTFADLWAKLGRIPLERIRAVPAAGTATEDDLPRAEGHTGRIYELIDGVLVEKAMGYLESLIAAKVIHCLMTFLERHDLGIVLGEAGTLKISPHQVRAPDVCFLAWERFPNRQFPAEPIPALVPDLAIEVLSEGNTEGEMQRKLHDYFAAGVRLVWYIDPRNRSAKSYTVEDARIEVSEAESLSGGEVLPGFVLPLKDLFAGLGA
jgi:Uma2 family endonuclease